MVEGVAIGAPGGAQITTLAVESLTKLAFQVGESLCNLTGDAEDRSMDLSFL